MSNNILKLDTAMNLIKEDLLRELSDSVIKESKHSRYIIKNVSFSENHMD